jgi:hypothetical protein
MRAINYYVTSSQSIYILKNSQSRESGTTNLSPVPIVLSTRIKCPYCLFMVPATIARGIPYEDTGARRVQDSDYGRYDGRGLWGSK